MKIVFISGPLTTGGRPEDKNYVRNNVKEAEKYQIALVNAGIGCFCAHTHTADHHAKGSLAPETFYYEMDFEFLKRLADALLAMPGWEKSKGATKEVEWAKENKLPIFYPKSPDDINDIIDWSRKK
ncbi:MAG: DUF4406 domain-containing protein [Patescibacteria group bacterium]